MGSQTLEILRQGVWASFTGGWFYDPHQDVFCNTFHLYIWLFLLCLPLTIYVYFPPTQYIWYFYCILVTAVLTGVKIINYGLHHMYDTTECIKEETEAEWPEQKREQERIELQILGRPGILSNFRPSPTIGKAHGSLASYAEVSAVPSTDIDSLESVEVQPVVDGGKPSSSTIDLKADVHRKNSSESSEELILPPGVPVACYELFMKEVKQRRTDRRKHQRSKTDSFVNISLANERPSRSSLRKRPSVPETGSDLHDNGCFLMPPAFQNVELEQTSEVVARHLDYIRNNYLNFHSRDPENIKPTTGSVELGYIDKNPIQGSAEGFYFDTNNRVGVRRIRSTTLETCCPPLSSLTVHPNSLEIIGCKSRNPLPPPSTSLVRNQHLNLCPYFGSEIVYPIAEQSDEHQTSHGPDTDLESLTHNSDSDYETNRDNISPYFYIKLRKMRKNVPYNSKHKPEKDVEAAREENASANSKDVLLENSKDALLENSNSSEPVTRLESYVSENDTSEKKLDSCSSTSLECLDRSKKSRSSERDLGVKKCDLDVKSKSIGNCNANGDSDVSDGREDTNGEGGVAIGAVKSGRNSRRKKRKNDLMKTDAAASCSSFMKLDIDWLFGDENDENRRIEHGKELLKRENDWAGSTPVSLEHDVSKVLQETVPAARSLGAIPKKSRALSSHNSDLGAPSTSSGRTAKTPKSESDKCSMCRAKTDDKMTNAPSTSKEHKITQTLAENIDTHLEGLECIVVPNSRLHPINFMSQKQSKTVNLPKPPNDEASSSSSNNELSSLLTPTGPLSNFLSSRRDVPLAVCVPSDNLKLDRSPQRSKLRRARANRRRSSHKNRRESVIASSLTAGFGTHCAKGFNDTSEGALHCFMDEQGNWVTYTFDEKGIGTANNRMAGDRQQQDDKTAAIRRPSDSAPVNQPPKIIVPADIWDSADSICNSSAQSIVREIRPVQRAIIEQLEEVRAVPDLVQRNSTNDAGDTVLNGDGDGANSLTARHGVFKFIQTSDAANNNRTRIKTYYKFKVFPWTFIKVTLDRLKLLALLDRNLTVGETLVSTVLAVLVSIFGAILLYLNFYEDLLAFIFCFIMASCQYSLLKSVQPDAASPTHGFNRIIAYSRPVYFCIFSLVILILHVNIPKVTEEEYFKLNISENTPYILLAYTRDFLIKFVLFFPVLFSFGLFPQVNTFVMYLFEQIDMHIFGGNAMSSLLASFYCVFRSVMAVLVLIGFCYGGLSETKTSQHILFSMFSACLVACSYHLSRCASDPTHLWNIVKKHMWPPDIYKEHDKMTSVETKEGNKRENKEKFKTKEKIPESLDNSQTEHIDPLPHKLKKTVNARLQNDIILCGLIAVVVFGVHASTVFTVLQPELNPVLWSMAVTLGFILHYVIPQLRKQLPWMCIARPILRSFEYGYFQTRGPAKIMWFERAFVYFCFIERNILYPLLFLSAITEDAPAISDRVGPLLSSLIVVVCALKCLRNSYSNQNVQYLILTFTALYFKYDFAYNDMKLTFVEGYFLMGIVFHKVYEFLLKVQFVVTYIAPWQITWGSAFHAFAQPFSVPHSAMLFLQTIISSILSTPLNPFLGSAIFLTSYVRPIKFWERDYNTRRVDHSNTPLSSHLERNLGADDNNLNSIFYEHLTRSLQHSLCGDLILGRWGLISQGDCFVLASDYLNCLVHVIELGNGLVTFQMRGLEFRGTYCQQREVEAITEGVEENDGCCCCDTGHLPNMLSVNAAFSQRWLAWEVTASKYILEGYSISDNSAFSMFQVFEFRRVLVSYYVKSIIFYTVRSPKLEEWLTSQSILKALQPMQDKAFVDLDPVFNFNIDEDYDVVSSGMTKNTFCQVHGDWIAFCAEKSGKKVESDANSVLVLLCFALSLLGRRTLCAVSHNTIISVEYFLYGLHALFKGDFRITCARDEWVFTDMDLLKTVVAPGVRMSLKLHQDHFMSPEEYEELPALFDAISKYEKELVISHEGDPAWRNAVLSGTPSLLALRYALDEGAHEYKVIMLNKGYLSFRVIKINKECVRGLWAGQQQELVYLRNRNPERGSIQNAKQALRNIINSSCDQPIGYPIYVSPLTTSYAETNEQYCQIVGGSVSLTKIKNYVFNLFRRIRKRCGEGCSSGGSGRDEIGMGHEGIYAMTQVTTLGHHNAGSQSTDGSHLGGSIGRGSSLSRASLGGNRGSLVSVGKPTSSTLASLAGLFKEKDERAVSQAPDAQLRTDERLGESNDTPEKEMVKVMIVDPNLVYDGINLGRRIDVSWPTEYMRTRGGRSYWNTWVPENGMEGYVVHKWTPGHRDLSKRSHVDRTILLIQIDDKFVPIAENGVAEVNSEL